MPVDLLSFSSCTAGKLIKLSLDPFGKVKQYCIDFLA